MNQSLVAIRNRAAQRTSELKMKEAFLNVLAFPFIAVGWIVGRVFWGGKYLAFLIVEGFRTGAKM